MHGQKKIDIKDLAQLLRCANINQFDYITESNEYQFLLYLDCGNQSNSVCHGTLQHVSSGCQLQIQPDRWRGRVVEPSELQRRNEILRQTLRYPPQFHQASDGIWLQASIASGTRLEYHFSATLLLMLRIVRDALLGQNISSHSPPQKTQNCTAQAL